MNYLDYSAPFGTLRLAADSAIRELQFPNQIKQNILPNNWVKKENDTLLLKLCERLDSYFAGHTVSFNDLPLRPTGTAFQEQVWQALSQIPYGASTTYGSISKQINNPKAVRAVGRAVGANPLAILLPCHRVLGQNGRLTGFAGGLDIKEILLRLEKITYRV